MKFRSISTRVFVLVISAVILTLIPIAALNYYYASSRINELFNAKMYESLQTAELAMQLELCKNNTDIRETVDGIRIGRTGRVFVIGSGGEYLAFLGEEKSADSLMQDDSEEALARLGAEMLKNRSGAAKLVRGDGTLRVYYSTMTDVDWTMAAVVDEAEILTETLSMFTFNTLIPMLGLVLMIGVIYLFVRYLRRIVRKVNNFADIAASGDFSKRVDVTETDEFGTMERHLNMMIEKMADMSGRSTELLNAAQSASRSKSDFLSRMSHEIRSPMNAIIGMTQIARASDSPQKIADCLSKIDTASKHLLALINDVLDMSKIEANKFELILEPFSLESTLNKVYDMMNVKAEEKSLRMTLSVDKRLPEFIIGDELRFSQVLTNLVSNAIKFTGENGHVDISATGVGVCGDEHTLRIDVKDSGIGLSSEQVKKLFRPFEQADGGIARKFGGTGLGLAINKRIVEMMNGDIWVESQPGQGSVFSFTLKVKAGELPAADAAKTRSRQRQHVVQARDMRILVVDDSEEATEYTSHVLDTLGFRCELAHDGAEAVEVSALAMAEGRPFDIIFMDYMMPKLNGIEAAKKIREITKENVSIVMVSMYDWKEFEHKAREAGIAKCVSKPISPSSVLDSISQVVPCIIKNNEAPLTPPSVGFSGNTILLVEDIEVNREIIAAFLEDTKVNIEFAVNGVEAVEKFGANPNKYDVILMDIQMPEMDGFEATRRIRAMNTAKAKTIPIVAMTANALNEDVRRCKEAGMNDHMAKPVDPEMLMLKLNDFFFMKSYLGKDIS